MFLCGAQTAAYTVHAVAQRPADGVGQRRGQQLADMLGGQQVAVAAMNRKAARSVRAVPGVLAGRAGRTGLESVTTPHDLR
jgi:D-alanyl-D-alanine carboxypeptidase (penicillin-binding protein 5/6)